jgi:hypothetical protein
MAAGADPNLTNSDGESAWGFAERKGRAGHMSVLRRYGTVEPDAGNSGAQGTFAKPGFDITPVYNSHGGGGDCDNDEDDDSHALVQ